MAHADKEVNNGEHVEFISDSGAAEGAAATGGAEPIGESPDAIEATDSVVSGDPGSDASATAKSGSGAGPFPARVVSAAAQDIGAFIRAQREQAQVSLRQLAERAGVSNPYLSQIERGLRKPSAEVLGQIAKGLRVSAEVLYMRAGILEQRDPSPVRDAILADPTINERQKQVMIEIYSSFCRENRQE
jgi:transcriptional regulator with XRE-family HTH domain